jgi:ABC-type lipoprotein export system ATPase subunit
MVHSQTFETTSSEIHLIRITKAYQTGWRRSHMALNSASLWIRRGETVSVVGPTG